MSGTREDRTAHWGTCSNTDCMTSMVIFPHPSAGKDLPGIHRWYLPPKSIDCPVCGDSIRWGGTEHPANMFKNY
jgi:hypothetical protein